MQRLWERPRITEIKALDKMATGIPGLDHLFEGGVVRGNSLLIEGPPGSGKTTFAIRVAYEGVVQYDESALIITFEEFPKQIYQECLSHGIDLESLEKTGNLRVIWTPPSRILEGFAGKNDLVEKVIEELGVRRLVIDSMTHFKRVATSEIQMREVISDILSYLNIRSINAILIKELERMDDETIAFEEYLVDASMRVYNSRSEWDGENRRFVEIRKSRGQGHVSGLHPFALSTEGISVYPRLRPKDVRSIDGGNSLDDAPARVTLGVDGIDTMLRGGLLAGSLNLVSGYTGTGKSVFALHFIDEGLKKGERCLLVSINRTAARTLKAAKSLGMDWDDAYRSELLRIVHFHPVGLCVDQMMNALLERIRDVHPARLVFDSIDSLWSPLKNEDKIRDYILVLAAILEGSETTSVLLHDCRNMGGGDNTELQNYSDLASCVLQLSIAESGGKLCRFVVVFKHSNSEHAKEFREFSIGLHVDLKATALSGVLSGQTTTASMMEDCSDVMPVLEEIVQIFHEIVNTVEFPDDFADRVSGAYMKLGLLDVLLREHFGISNFQQEVEEALAKARPG